MLLYYITDRQRFPGSESGRRELLLERIEAAARCGIEFIQLREKDLSARELEQLAAQAREVVLRARTASTGSTRLLINTRIDVALAAQADGVHLPAADLPASEARAIWAKASAVLPIITTACHSVDEVALAEAEGADLALFGPVFEKGGQKGFGLRALRGACRRKHAASPAIPVVALGGVTLKSAGRCLEAGAAGVAGIRLFQDGDVETTVRALRELGRAPSTP